MYQHLALQFMQHKLREEIFAFIFKTIYSSLSLAAAEKLKGLKLCLFKN